MRWRQKHKKLMERNKANSNKNMQSAQTPTVLIKLEVLSTVLTTVKII